MGVRHLPVRGGTSILDLEGTLGSLYPLNLSSPLLILAIKGLSKARDEGETFAGQGWTAILDLKHSEKAFFN